MPVSRTKKHRLDHFLRRFALDERQSVAREVDRFRGMAPAQCWQELQAVCEDTALMINARADRAALIAERDAPHPSYDEAMERLKARFRARRRRGG